MLDGTSTVGKEAAIKEFEEARRRYQETLSKLIGEGTSATAMMAAKCSVGEVCHGGEF